MLLCYSEFYCGDIYSFLSTELLMFEDSEKLCVFNYDQHLASIYNIDENNDSAWFGLNDIVNENIWQNIDGTEWDFGTTIYIQKEHIHGIYMNQII